MVKKSLLLGLVLFIFFSATIASAAAPTIAGLSAAFKGYVSLPKPVQVADLMAAYKNFVSSPAPTTPAP
jgi:hypothetical protein